MRRKSIMIILKSFFADEAEEKKMVTTRTWVAGGWQGAGWYAGCHELDSDRKDVEAWYFLGNDQENEPDTFGRGLSRAHWFNEESEL